VADGWPGGQAAWVCYHDNSKLHASILTKLGLLSDIHRWRVSLSVILLLTTVAYRIFLTRFSIEVEYLKNGVSYGQTYYCTLIWNRTQYMEWYHVWWPWLTFKRVAWFVSDSWVYCFLNWGGIHSSAWRGRWAVSDQSWSRLLLMTDSINCRPVRCLISSSVTSSIQLIAMTFLCYL